MFLQIAHGRLPPRALVPSSVTVVMNRDDLCVRSFTDEHHIEQ